MLGLFGGLVDIIIVIIKALYMLKCIRLPRFVHFSRKSRLFVLFHYSRNDLLSRTHWSAAFAKEANMLSVSDILTVSITKNLLNLHALLPLDPRDLSSGIVDQSSANLLRGTLPHLAIRSRS
jgi:hypothetical protein